ncbi:hypothetical protein [uncultured Microscilla sp.]|uniref:hypothetical protein n=1 Tax=uncultured Microscilla sp. TaxID=432653 RepID=UPI0026173795|nr:hypothetical protein [uncultured Microscilla sp.]
MKKIYKRQFKIWGYTVSHSFLILRSPMKYKDVVGFSEEESHNIDIEFFAVAYLDIPNILSGIELGEVKDNIPEKFKRYVKEHKYKVFEIKSEQNIYHIVAGGYSIGKNTWDIEDRISNMHLKHDEILFSI